MVEKKLIHVSYHSHLLRWFILLWMGFIYFWGIGSGDGDNSRTVTVVILFTVLMVIHTGIHWVYLSGLLSRSGQKGLLLFSLLQGVLALGICLLIHGWNVSISLYLTLLLETSTFQRKTRFVALSSYLFLFVLAVLSLYVLEHHQSVIVLRSIVEPLILFAVGYAILYLQQTRTREQTQQLLSDLEVAHAQLSSYAIHVEELTLAAERQRMARELHDTLVQGLAGLTMQLEVANLRLTNQRYEQAQETILQAMGRTRATLAEARKAIYDLRLEIERTENFVLAVQKEIEHFTTTSGIPCKTEIEALSFTPSALRIHIFRMIAEGLTNVACHAQAKQTWVSAFLEVGGVERKLFIEVSDDGQGFDPAEAATRVGHYGLMGLRERARLMDGKLEVHSAPGKGTKLRLCLPVEQKGMVDE